MHEMRLRQLNIGCFGGSSGQLRDELGVLPPGDILKCALALSRNAREARRVLLARLPTLEHARLGGHTGGNLLLSMMQRYSGDFLDAIDGLRGIRRRVDDAGRSRSRCGADVRPVRPEDLARAAGVDPSDRGEGD